MTNSQALVAKLYRSVIDDVINGVRDSFLDEGVDEAVLQELKQLWETKLTASKAIEPTVDPAEVALMTKLQSQGAAKGGGTGAQTNAKAAQQAAAVSQQASQQQPQQPESQPTGASATPVPAGNQPVAVKMVPVQITVPAQAGVPSSTAKTITVQVPAHALQGGAAGAQLQAVLSSPTITSTLTLPPDLAANVLQQQINAALQTSTARQNAAVKGKGVTQLDGALDTSDDEDDLDDDDDDVDDDDADKEDDEEAEEQEGEQEEEPLNSEDDVSDEDPTDLFETDNVVVCQYDKITRSRNRWKFHLKDGIMSLAGKDYVFQKANGDAEW